VFGVCAVPLASLAHPTEPTIQNTTDTIIHANRIIINQTPACLRIVNPFLYFPSSPAAVTIWNPHHNTIHNVIKANIPSTQLIQFLITSNNCDHFLLDSPTQAIHETHVFPLRPAVLAQESVLAEATPIILQKAAIHIIITASNFVFMLF
jgi:hypothetical protein